MLELAFVRQVEEAVLAILDAGKATGEWHFREAFVESLTAIVNEYDRQLREVRLAKGSCRE